MDEIFGRLDDLFLDGNFADADRLLQVIDLEQLDTNLLVGLMCISCPARKQLPSYDALLLRVRARLGQLAPNRVEALMKGFN